MQLEPMFGSDGKTIIGYGWFCTVKDCDGYGGPAENAAPRSKPKPIQDYAQEKLL
jgi:hypothetical protein